jgi:hypothetical protein
MQEANKRIYLKQEANKPIYLQQKRAGKMVVEKFMVAATERPHLLFFMCNSGVPNVQEQMMAVATRGDAQLVDGADEEHATPATMAGAQPEARSHHRDSARE